jgi:hypothetical protein
MLVRALNEAGQVGGREATTSFTLERGILSFDFWLFSRTIGLERKSLGGGRAGIKKRQFYRVSILCALNLKTSLKTPSVFNTQLLKTGKIGFK